MMICGLAKDVKSKTFYSKLKFGIKDSQLGWEKEYYNELVCFYNRFKAQKINSILAKALDFSDEKLY